MGWQFTLPERDQLSTFPMERFRRCCSYFREKHRQLFGNDVTPCLDESRWDAIGARDLVPFQSGNQRLNLPGPWKCTRFQVVTSGLESLGIMLPLHVLPGSFNAGFNVGKLPHPGLLLFLERGGNCALQSMEHGERACPSWACCLFSAKPVQNAEEQAAIGSFTGGLELIKEVVIKVLYVEIDSGSHIFLNLFELVLEIRLVHTSLLATVVKDVPFEGNGAQCAVLELDEPGLLRFLGEELLS